MRTTLALDDDNYQRLREIMHKERCSFRDAVNAALRRGLDRKPAGAAPRFKVRPFASGPAPGADWDDASRLLDQVEGPGWR